MRIQRIFNQPISRSICCLPSIGKFEIAKSVTASSASLRSRNSVSGWQVARLLCKFLQKTEVLGTPGLGSGAIFHEQKTLRSRISRWRRSGSLSLGRRVQVIAMTLRDLILDVFRTLWSHKLRAFLTMF